MNNTVETACSNYGSWWSQPSTHNQSLSYDSSTQPCQSRLHNDVKSESANHTHTAHVRRKEGSLIFGSQRDSPKNLISLRRRMGGLWWHEKKLHEIRPREKSLQNMFFHNLEQTFPPSLRVESIILRKSSRAPSSSPSTINQNVPSTKFIAAVSLSVARDGGGVYQRGEVTSSGYDRMDVFVRLGS